jgi:hypothetical protein
MRSLHLVAAAALFAVPAQSQAIIAQSSGLSNPDAVIDFGANLFPNFTPVTTQFAGITLTHARYFTTGVSNNLVGGFITNDPAIGLPNTLRIQFASLLTDISFVYHQIGQNQATNFRALLVGTTMASFSNLSNQFQPNNYFGFTNTAFDEVQIDFDGDFNVDTLAVRYANGARCTTRNGSGINPVGFTCTTRPVLGTNWQSQIAMTANTITTYIAFAPGGPQTGTLLPPFGEVLVQLSPSPVLVPGSGSYSVAIPNLPIWLGYPLSTQGVRFDVVGGNPTFVLLNALDLVLGL